MVRVKGLANFKAQDAKELSFRDNEILTLLDEASPPGWVTAQNARGKSGWVPEAWVEAIRDATAAVDVAAEKAAAERATAERDIVEQRMS